MASPGQRLKDLIDAPEILVLPGIYDGFSAQLVEAAGFKAAAISGAGTSESRLGWADTGIMGGLEDMGVAVVTYPRILTAAAIKGMQNALSVLGQSLERGEVIDRPDLLVSFDEINTLMGLPQLRALEERHLSAEDRERKYGKAAK